MTEVHQKPLIGAYLMLFDGNKILLSKSNRGALKGKYSMVAGHTDEGETVIEGVIREAKEEADIILNPEDMQVVVAIQRPQAAYKGTPTDIIDFFITAARYDGKINNNEPEKCCELAFFDIDSLPTETMPHVAEAIRLYKNKEFFGFYREPAK